MDKFSHLSSAELTCAHGFDCSCGQHHRMHLKFLRIAPRAVESLPEAIRTLGCSHPMLVCAPDVFPTVGTQVSDLLRSADIPHRLFVVPADSHGRVEPAEEATGSVILNFDRDCDLLIGLGSGVINDICRVVSSVAKVPMLIVGTAPSMDGYASASSSMVVNHVKQSLALQPPDGIILDTDIMAAAPMKLLQAGFGDILAKYTALCEWKLAHLLWGEPYCKEVANLVRQALDMAVEQAADLKLRKPAAVQAVAEALIASGIGMAFVGHSRPASGLDHYFSHCWEMMALAKGQDYELHGIQVGLGTLYTVMLLEKLKSIHPTMPRVKNAAAAFDKAHWEANLSRVFGATAAKGIIALETRIEKNSPQHRMERAQKIIDNWDEVLHIIDTSLPSSETIRALMEDIGLPIHCTDIGVSTNDVKDAFICSRDIRDKYLTSSLIWDIAYMDEFAEWLHSSISR